MVVKNITCPVLNKFFLEEMIQEFGSLIPSIPPVEVFVRFNGEFPSDVMCDHFNVGKRACSISNSPCIYSKWREYIP